MLQTDSLIIKICFIFTWAAKLEYLFWDEIFTARVWTLRPKEPSIYRCFFIIFIQIESSLFQLPFRSRQKFLFAQKNTISVLTPKTICISREKKTRTTAMLKMCLFNSENIKATSPLIDWFSSSNEIFFIHIEIWNIFSTNFRCSGTLAFAQF